MTDAKATEPLTLPGGRSHSPAPNPKAFKLDWPLLQEVLDKQLKLHDEAHELDFEYVQARDHLQRLEASEVDVLAEALRSGEDAPDVAQEIARARAGLEEIEKRSAVLRRAHEKGAAELRTLVNTHKDEWGAEAHARAQEKVREVEDAVAHLRSALGELYAAAAVTSWIEQPDQSFGFAQGPDNLDTFSGRIKPSEVYDAIVQDARAKAATPDALEKQKWASLGAVDSPGVGWVG